MIDIAIRLNLYEDTIIVMHMNKHNHLSVAWYGGISEKMVANINVNIEELNKGKRR